MNHRLSWTKMLVALNLVLLVSLALLLTGNTAWARALFGLGAPRMISYQGVLTDSSGQPFYGTKSLKLRVFGVESGGAPLLQETQPSVVFKNGAFALLIGKYTALPDNLFDSPDRWLEIEVDGATLTPRQKFTSVPYALNADKVDGLDASQLGGSGGSLPSGAVVWFPEGAAAPGFTRKTDALGHDIGSWTSAALAPINGLRCGVWTGTEALCWTGNETYGAGGARYNPATNTWRGMSNYNAPSPRSYSLTLWTGTEMILWGGSYNGATLNTGGRYNSASDLWAPVTTSGAPSAQDCAVWTGTEMIVGGGGSLGSGSPWSGGRYSPATDRWRGMNTNGAPQPSAFGGIIGCYWTGSRALVWGVRENGSTASRVFVGALYDPNTDTWSAIPALEGAIGGGGTWMGDAFFVPHTNDGGFSFNLASFRPQTNAWQQRSYMPSSDSGGVSWTFIPAGRWLLTNAGLYDPSTDTWAMPREQLSVGGGMWLGDRLLNLRSGVPLGIHRIEVVYPYVKN